MSAPNLYVMDEEVREGLRVRTLLAADISSLPSIITDDGDEPYCKANTNRGTLLCAVGTIAHTAGYGTVKQLGATGWESV